MCGIVVGFSFVTHLKPILALHSICYAHSRIWSRYLGFMKRARTFEIACLRPMRGPASYSPTHLTQPTSILADILQNLNPMKTLIKKGPARFWLPQLFPADSDGPLDVPPSRGILRVSFEYSPNSIFFCSVGGSKRDFFSFGDEYLLRSPPDLRTPALNRQSSGRGFGATAWLLSWSTTSFSCPNWLFVSVYFFPISVRYWHNMLLDRHFTTYQPNYVPHNFSLARFPWAQLSSM